MKDVLFMQPRHQNAPLVGTGSIYMPTAVLSVASRLLHAGQKVDFYDGNFGADLPSNFERYDMVGLHTIGPSCLSKTYELVGQIKDRYPFATILLGGQVINSLDKDPVGDPQNFNKLFGGRAKNGNLEATLAETLAVDPSSLPSAFSCSLVPAYAQFDSTTLKEYLNRPFSFFTSQGCKYSCSFCAAVRTREGSGSGSVRVRETYRTPKVMREDLDYLCTRAEELGVPSLTMYLSNLDVFQTPQGLAGFLDVVSDVRGAHPKVDLRFTALSTTASFQDLKKHHPSLLHRARASGLDTIGFGVEGMSKDYWDTLRKSHNKQDDCYNAIIAAQQEFNFRPEILLTPGHPHDTKDTLDATLDYARHMKSSYGATIRPYAAKSWLTGNSGWFSPAYAREVNTVLRHPELFQNLDINALQSKLVEPDHAKRKLVNDTYISLCALSEGAAQPLLPIELGMSPQKLAHVRIFNEGKYDH